MPHPTRCVLLRNIPPGIDDDDIRRLLHTFGPLRDLGAQQRSRGGRGSLLATYFDLRHARAAVRALDSSMHFGRRLEARFQCPSDIHHSHPVPSNSSSPQSNQGTLVVFNLDTTTSAEDIRALFSTVGDVKEIRATPNKKHHKFVEFYDVRDAERAMHLLNKTEVAGKRIKIEISRPGGRAASFSRHTPKPHAIASSLNHSRHQASVQYQPEQTFRSSPRHQSHELQPSLMSSFSQPISSPFAHSSPSASFDTHPAISPNLASVVSPSGFDATNSLSGSFDRAFSNKSSDVEFPNMHSSYDSAQESRIFQAASGQHHSDVHSFFPNSSHVQRYPSSAPTQPTAKHAPDSYIQALYNSPGSDEEHALREESPRRAQFMPMKSLSTLDSNGTSRFRATFGEALVPRNNSHARMEPGTPGSAAGKVGSVATIGDCSFALKQSGTKPGSHAGSCTTGNKSFASQRPNANSKYSLDIKRVRTGEETRTALMIRNIPNKYNQKMLLSTLDDGHRGHFDFVYLPIDFKNKCNVGYAFINFLKPEYIEPFYEAFHGKKWGRFNSEKVCEITFARIQGLQQLMAHFQNSSLLLEDPKCRPVIFDIQGRQEEFPVGSHVRTRRGPSSRESAHRTCEPSPAYSPSKHRGSR